MKSLRCAVSVGILLGVAIVAPEASADSMSGENAAVPAVRLWQYPNFRGHSHTIYLAGPCTSGGGPEAGVPDMGQLHDADDPPIPFWDNRVRSVETINQCLVKFYDGVTYLGQSTGWLRRSADLGKANASSLVIM